MIELKDLIEALEMVLVELREMNNNYEKGVDEL